MATPMSYEVNVSGTFEDAIAKVTETLKQEGFGVLSRIDVQQTLKDKLEVDFRPYVILGACNPPLAYQALQSDPQVGLLLPCNVTVQEINDGVLIQIINPEAMLGIKPLSENGMITEVAAEANTRLKRVAAALSNELANK